MNFTTKYSNSFALVIGVDEYVDCSPLTNACNDARAVAKALEKYAQFEKTSIQVLLNKEATKRQVLAAFLGLRKICSPNDRIVVFFAGHGHSEAGNKKQQGFLVPVDGKIEDLDTLIRWQELVEGAEMIPAKHILFVMDACFSGLLMQRAAPAQGSRFVSDMLTRYSRQAITAGKADQTVADGGRGQNSIFTESFIEGLAGGATDKNGLITASSAMHYAYNKVSRDPRSDQTPHYGHLEGDGDMVLAFPKNVTIDADISGDILTDRIVEVPERPAAEAHANQQAPKDATFGDVENPAFGQNNRTQKLCRRYWHGGDLKTEQAASFATVLALPSGPIDCGSKLPKIVSQFQARARNNTEQPFWGRLIPHELRSTLNSVILFQTDSTKRDLYNRYVHISQNGRVELSDVDNVVRLWSATENASAEPHPYWRFVGTIGFFHAAIEACRLLYADMGYTGGVHVSLNLVNTLGSRLVDYSKGKGLDNKHWRNPFDFEARAFGGLPGGQQCEDKHIRLEYQLTQSDFKGTAVQSLIDDAATKISLAFDKRDEHLLCYNYGTKIFPWDQFVASWDQ